MKATITGTKSLSAKLANMQQAVSKKKVTALIAGALVVQNAAKVNAGRVFSPDKRTGNLQRSIHIGGEDAVGIEKRGDERVPPPEESEDRATVYVGTDVEYAAIHEFGGEIRPKTAKALVFEVDGEVVMTQKVTMPARPYMRPAIDENQEAVLQEVAEAFRDLIRDSA